MTETSAFAPRATTEQVEEGRLFAPKFGADGLITCVVTDAWSAEVLMVAHMNPDALAKTITTGEAWFYSEETPIAHRPEGFESVVNLGLGEVWPPAPTANGRKLP